MRTSVDHDATTTPAPDETIVRAALRALIARLLPATALRAVTARPVVKAVTRSATVQLRAATVQLRAAKEATKLVMVLRAATVQLLVEMVQLRAVMVPALRAARAGTSSATVHLLVAMAIVVRAATRSAKAATRAVTVRLVGMTAVPVGADSRSAAAPVATGRTVRATIVRATMILRSLRTSPPRIFIPRRATN